MFENRLEHLIRDPLPNPPSRIGIKMSGGVDSSLLAYGIANYLCNVKSHIQLFPIIIVEKNSPFQEIFSSQIIKFIESTTKSHFEPPIVYQLEDYENKIQKMRDIESSLKNLKSLSIIASGVTQAPPQKSFKHPGGPDESRVGKFPIIWDNFIFTPFVNINKKRIAKMYNEENLINTMLKMTRSCVEQTNDFSKHCGECWWCKERMWAFGNS